MHPLAFMTTWLMGAASAGDKEARAALNLMFPALVADLSWDLEMMRSGIVKNIPNDIREGLRRILGGLAPNNGDSCTKHIIHMLKAQTGEYAARVVATAAMTLPKDKLVPALKDMLAVLESKPCDPKS